MSEILKKEPSNKSTMLMQTNAFIKEIENFANNIEVSFTEKEKQIVMNAIRVIDPILAQNGLTWNYFASSPQLKNNVVNVLQQTAFLKLNPVAIPRECFYIIRNVKLGDNTYQKQIEFGIEGAGNDSILRTFGVNVADVKSYIVYEGDEFSGVIFDGFEEIPPKYVPKLRKNGESKGKALYAVYLVKKTNGSVETLIAEREDVKVSLLAHIRQNGADEKLLRELERLTIDEILLDEKWLEYKLKKETWVKVNGKTMKKEIEVDLIGPGWKSPISREKMIERKMRNHAIRRYPKDFSHGSITKLYEETFEDEKYANGQLLIKEDVVQPADLIDYEYENVANQEKVEIKEEEHNTSLDFTVIEEDDVDKFFNENNFDEETGELKDNENQEEKVENLFDDF